MNLFLFFFNSLPCPPNPHRFVFFFNENPLSPSLTKSRIMICYQLLPDSLGLAFREVQGAQPWSPTTWV